MAASLQRHVQRKRSHLQSGLGPIQNKNAYFEKSSESV